MKISHKLVASFVGVSLLRSVVGAVAIADNGCAIPETAARAKRPAPANATRNGLNLSYPLTELFCPILHSLFYKLHRIFRKKNFQQGSERAKVLLRCNC
ncbi:hypothetical protein IQ277_01755 [Nostocales cyanobacterium LEGE 12452]|nr:hypothetical protein [Nostocales cyanobacterium LEGE 12452]